ncbi:hypothetical protein SBADM41S_01720 [Streptomyces badius]
MTPPLNQVWSARQPTLNMLPLDQPSALLQRPLSWESKVSVKLPPTAYAGVVIGWKISARAASGASSQRGAGNLRDVVGECISASSGGETGSASRK